MKSSLRLFLISLLVISPWFLTGCSDDDHKNHDHNDDIHGLIDPKHKLVSMRVVAVPCEDCQAKIEGALKAVDGVVKYQVFKDVERSQNVIIVYDPSKTDIEKIKDPITKLGKTIDNVIES